MSYKTPEQIRRESIERLKRLRPIDDIFMREMFRNNIELTEFVLRAITEISDLVITEVHTQYDLHRLAGSHSLRIDVHGRDSADRRYSMEIERSDKGASPYRSRYISSAMDVEFLNTGDEFTDLPVSYVIFITESDIFGEGKLVYRIERMNVTTGKPFNDGEHIIYLNSSYKNEGETSELAELAHDFLCENPDDMHLPLMAETARYYKENPKVQLRKVNSSEGIFTKNSQLKKTHSKSDLHPKSESPISQKGFRRQKPNNDCRKQHAVRERSVQKACCL